jgi:hypothetical protein
MNPFTPHEQIIRELFDLDNHTLEAILAYIETLSALRLPDDDDAVNDPMIGMFDGEPDLATRSQEILRRKFG